MRRHGRLRPASWSGPAAIQHRLVHSPSRLRRRLESGCNEWIEVAPPRDSASRRRTAPRAESRRCRGPSQGRFSMDSRARRPRARRRGTRRVWGVEGAPLQGAAPRCGRHFRGQPKRHCRRQRRFSADSPARPARASATLPAVSQRRRRGPSRPLRGPVEAPLQGSPGRRRTGAAAAGTGVTVGDDQDSRTIHEHVVRAPRGRATATRRRGNEGAASGVAPAPDRGHGECRARSWARRGGAAR